MPSRPPKDKVLPRERVARLRGRAGQDQRKRRLARTDGLCERCEEKGFTVFATVVDHIDPLALGGSDDDSNTRNLCDDCHRDVTAEQFGHQAVGGCGADGLPLDPSHPWNRGASGTPQGSKV